MVKYQQEVCHIFLAKDDRRHVIHSGRCGHRERDREKSKLKERMILGLQVVVRSQKSHYAGEKNNIVHVIARCLLMLKMK